MFWLDRTTWACNTPKPLFELCLVFGNKRPN